MKPEYMQELESHARWLGIEVLKVRRVRSWQDVVIALLAIDELSERLHSNGHKWGRTVECYSGIVVEARRAD